VGFVEHEEVVVGEVVEEGVGRFAGCAPVEVTVSRNSISRVVVEKGLAPGDRVALRDPTAVPQTPAAAAGPGGRAERRP
jgi:hypothetical protein